MEVRSISEIGEYQLGNLISNKVPFLFYYILEPEEERPDHPLFEGISFFEGSSLVDEVNDKATDTSFPLVLVCRNGQQSMSAAQTLAVAGYINIFVVQGGFNELV